nr:leucine-rich repeat domain-containing protein [Bacteroidaceae bacterium]
MKNRILFIALMLLMGAQTAVNAQELTVSDVQDSGCQRGTRAQANEREKRWTIILTKEGDILTVQLLGFIANCGIAGFDVTPSMSGGSDGTPYSVSIGVEPIEFEVQATCVCPYNVSFTVHGLETNSFSFSCWWYNGQVTLTEGEPLTLESITEYVTIDSYIYFIDKVSHTASFVGLDAGVTMGSGALKDVSIPSETDYEGQKYIVTSIGEGTLMGHSRITSLTIPESVTSIKDYALTYCSSLKDVYCYAENVPQTGEEVFGFTPIASATLNVPAGSLEKYKTTSPWNEFGSIVALPETNTFIQDIAWVDGFGYEQDGQYKLDDVKLFYYSVAGDTLINGKYYFRIQRKRINKTHCELDVDEYSCETEEDTLCFFMREDEVGDVWFYTENKDVFEKISHNTLYNDYNLADDLICRDLFLFNVKKKYAIGETLPLGMIALDSPNGFREGQDYWDIYPYEVKSIDEMTLLDGKTYKLYNDYILEGIGPLNGPLIGIGTSNSYGLDFNQLFAFYRDGQLIYRNEGYLSALEEHFPNILDIVTGKRQNDPDDNTTDSLYGEWWLVGWNDGGDWFEVDTNYVSHQSLSIELKDKKEGPSMAYSIVNEIFVGNLTLNGNEMFFTEGGASTAVYADVNENLFFEEHICDIKSYQLEENQLRLYYTDEDYFVFTNDFDDSEEHHYEWKNGPADPYISEVTAMNDEEVEVKIVQCPSYVTFYSRTTPPHSSSDICRFAMSDLAGLSFEVGDKVAFLITMFKRQKVEKGGEYQLKVEPIEGSEHITNRTGKIHNDSRMGWIIIDDKVNEKQGGIYYYPLRKLAEEYLTEGLSVRFSGDLYPTWKTPWDNEGNSDCYYLSIDAINTPHEYFPEGTKWTEIRLDTLKFNSWYSKVGNEWVPNFETIEYSVQGEYGGEGNPYSNDPYKCVYTNSSEWTDSLTLLISEGELNGFPTGILVTVYDNEIDQPLVPSSYPFEWEVGTMIRFK